MALTIKELTAAKPGEWLSDGGTRGGGTLVFRRTAQGATLAYFRYTLPNGKRDALALGQFDEHGRDGMTLSQARARAGELSKLYQTGVRNIREHLAAQRAAEDAERRQRKEAEEARAREAEARQRYTLRTLCEGYADTLDNAGKSTSAKHARSIFKCHVYVPHPELAATPAREITPHHIATLVRQVRETGKERTAGVLRAYLSAAYNAAKGAPFDSSLPASLIPFDVQHNPVDAIKAIPVRAGNRTLTRVELAAYLQSLGEGVVDTALRVALLAGGQRMAQLLRATVNDYDQDNGTLRLWDGKGKRAEPREHLLPLGPQAAALACQLVSRAKQMDTPWLFSSYGKVRVTDSTPGKRVSEIAATLQGEPFDLRDLRRTVETMLAALGISRDTRAQLLSHGLSGVQTLHYDRHTYTAEKRNALIAWEAHLGAIMTEEPFHGTVKIQHTA